MGKCGLNPGLLRHRVELHEATATRDSYGQPVETFAVYATVWASIEPLRMSERVHAEQLQGERTHLVIIRYNDDVAITDRVIFGSRVFEVVSILNTDERKKTLHLECKEIV